MAIAFSQSLGTGSATSAGLTTTISFTGGTKPAVGDCVIVACSRDNLATDPATGDTCTDSDNNYYLRVDAKAGSTTTLAGGIVGVLFCSIISTAWTAGTNTITWTHPSVTARAVQADHFTGCGGYRVGSKADGSTTAGANISVTTGATSPVNGDLVYGLTAAEYGSNVAPSTVDTDTTNGSWSTTAFIGNGTASVSGCKVATQYKIVNASAAQTFGPIGGFGATTNVDVVGIVAVFLPTRAAISTLVDSFDTAIDAAKWTTRQGTAPVIVGGQAQFVTQATYVELGSAANYSLMGSAIYFQSFPWDSPSHTHEFALQLQTAGSWNNMLTVYHSNNDPVPYMGFQYWIASSSTTSYLTPYLAATHRWWRIREAVGTVYWDTSADALTWTNRSTIDLNTLGWQPNDLQVILTSGYTGTEAEPTYQYADNVNVALENLSLGPATWSPRRARMMGPV